jgi:dolichol-phosphate hexosyltransferase
MTSSLPKKKKIAALIPCYNEAGGIAAVIKSFPSEKIRSHGYEIEIIVIDNNSKDKTAEIAKKHGATVLHEPKQGKGHAMRLGFRKIPRDADYVVMLDGDNTYRPEEILRMVEPLESQFSTVVIGSRLGGRLIDGAMTSMNRLGNWCFSHMVRYFYQVNVTDALTGYFAWTREALDRLTPNLESNGFAIEMEMVTKMARLGEEICSVPITYHPRAGETKLRPFRDGVPILWMFTKNLRWKPVEESKKKKAVMQKKINAI